MARIIRWLLEREFRMHFIAQCRANLRGEVVWWLVALAEASSETVGRVDIHTGVTRRQLVNLMFERTHMQSIGLIQYAGTSNHRRHGQRLQVNCLGCHSERGNG
jgi:hypothetical protein